MKTTQHATTLPLPLLETIASQYGCVTSDDVQALTEDPDGRLLQLLVRCGSSRFICAAQDVDVQIARAEALGDYVRDVSIPAGHTLWQVLDPLIKAL
tara:strand:- start:1369 stop:1659 length:291 start_codon:yes stop_codon:yes gene_type:complete